MSLIKNINNLGKNNFIKNVAILASGATIAQAIPVLVSPILTRIYSPKEFGVLAIFIAITAILTTIATGRYQFAIMLPKVQTPSVLVITLGIYFSILVAFIVFLIVYNFGDVILNASGFIDLKPVLYFIPLYILLTGLNLVLTTWFNREKEFKYVAVGRVALSLTAAILSILLGLLEDTQNGLIYAMFAGQLVFSLILYIRFLSIYPQGLNFFAWKKLLLLMKKYKHFPLVDAPAALINSLATQAPIFFIGHYFTIAQLGFFNLTNRVVYLPASLIGVSMGQVYHQKIAENYRNEKDVLSTTINTSKYLFIIGLIPTIILILFAPDLFRLVFGEAWAISGEFAQILAVSFLIKFSVSPITSIFTVTGHITRCTYWRVAYFVSTILVLWLASQLTIKSFLIVYVVHDILFYAYYYYLAILSIKEIKK